MKALTVVCLLASFAVSTLCEVSSDDKKVFEDFKKKFNKEYKSKDEEQRAMENFLKNKKEVDEHNKLYEAGKKSYSTAVFEHSDLSEDEMYQYLSGVDEVEDEAIQRTKRGFYTYGNEHYPTGPAAINWTEKGIVGPIGSQKHCGSCWTFSTTGIVETVLLKKGISARLSEQQLIDCETYKAKGCKGGHARIGLNYIQENGIAKEEDYPYKAEDGKCKYTKDMKFATIDKVIQIKTKGNETFMRDVVGSAGPVSVTICLTHKFHHIHDGVFHIDECCGKRKMGLHAPIVTGYGTDPKHGDYWIVKNSWGTSWGVNGYAKVRRGSNMCGIARHALYAE